MQINLAVKLYRDIPEHKRPEGIPLDWPALVMELGDSMELPNDGTQWYLMTCEGYEAYKVQFQAAYDAWENAYLSPKPLDIVKDKIKQAREFGLDLIAEYGASNVLAGFNVEQVRQIMMQTEPIIAALQTGSLYVAMDLLTKLEPDEVLIFRSVRDHYLNKIKDFLGVPH